MTEKGHESMAMLLLTIELFKPATVRHNLVWGLDLTGKTDGRGRRHSLLGIRHQRTDLDCPWQNGRIERLFGTLKQKLDRWQVPDRAQLNCDLGIFRYWYNHIRPHRNLDGKTPAEAWSGVDPYKKAPKHEHWFEAWDGLLAGYCLT